MLARRVGRVVVASCAVGGVMLIATSGATANQARPQFRRFMDLRASWTAQPEAWAARLRGGTTAAEQPASVPMVTLETVNADVAVGGVKYQLNTTVSKDLSAGFHPAVFSAELFRGSFGPTRFALQAHEYGFAPAEGLGFSFADTPASNLPAPVADAHGATARIRTVGSAFASGVATFTSTSAPHVGRVQTCKAQGHVHSFRTYSYAGAVTSPEATPLVGRFDTGPVTVRRADAVLDLVKYTG